LPVLFNLGNGRGHNKGEFDSDFRLLKDTTPLQRGIIRHLILVLDMSEAMTEKDLRPTRYELMINYAIDFVTEYFEQNPISQLGVIGMRDGLAVRISDLSGKGLYNSS
jgi:transcription initiation factor TFIIH subunit 2